MKKIFLALAVAGSVASVPAFAAGEVHHDSVGSVYGGVTLSDTGLEDSGVGVKVGYNRTLDSVYPGVSVDVEGTSSVIDSESEALGLEASYYSVASYARYTHGLDAITYGLDGYARVGFGYSSVELNDVEVSDGFDPSYGLGLSYDLTPSVSVFADYTVNGSDVDIDEFTGGVKFVY